MIRAAVGATCNHCPLHRAAFQWFQWGRHVASKICTGRNREGLPHEPRAPAQRWPLGISTCRLSGSQLCGSAGHG